MAYRFSKTSSEFVISLTNYFRFAHLICRFSLEIALPLFFLDCTEFAILDAFQPGSIDVNSAQSSIPTTQRRLRNLTGLLS